MVVTRSDDAGPRLRTTIAPAASTGLGGVVRPLLGSCAATQAQEGTATGAGVSDPERPGEVFAVPLKGASGPLALLVRFPAGAIGNGTVGPLIPNTEVAGHPANLSVRNQGGDQGGSGITWAEDGGGTASLYTRDLPAADIEALAEAIAAPGTALPAGLVSVGTTETATWARSTCTEGADQGLVAFVEVVHGSPASRYARLVSDPPGLRWDDGDATFVVGGKPGSIPTSPPPIHDATDAEWNAILTLPDTATTTTTSPAQAAATTEPSATTTP